MIIRRCGGAKSELGRYEELRGRSATSAKGGAARGVRRGWATTIGLWASVSLAPLTAHAQLNQPKPGQGAPSKMPDPVAQTQGPPAAPSPDEPIVPDAVFEKAVPSKARPMPAARAKQS